MKAIVFRDIGDIRLEDVPEPKIEQPTDAIVQLTSSAICGTDLHMVRGTMSGMVPGTVLGHEGVGIVVETGKNVRNLKKGDRVIIPSTIACGTCSYCRAGYYSQCDNANPNGSRAGTAFFGGPKMTGPFHGLQAEYARIPFANIGPVKVPDDMTDDAAILLSDIFPTGYFGADIAEIEPGDVVLVYGCGPVGLFAILSAFMMDAGRVLAVDRMPSRLERARLLGAETINFDEEDPVQIVMELTSGIGADRVIDAVGIDAEPPSKGPAAAAAKKRRKEFQQQLKAAAPEAQSGSELWKPGQAPSQALDWSLESIAKAGTLSVIGVYPLTDHFFPWGEAMNRNLTINAGNCPHRRYLPHLIELVSSGAVDPRVVLSHEMPLDSALEAYKKFDQREEGWIKVELRP
jgi:threonine dehydrogenase-like Zn-dependent dehydrogenase